MTWIKCTDTMPPVGEQVLAAGPNKGQLSSGVNAEVCVWDGIMWWDEGGTEMACGAWGDTSWTYWMPIPPLPPELSKGPPS